MPREIEVLVVCLDVPAKQVLMEKREIVEDLVLRAGLDRREKREDLV